MRWKPYPRYKPSGVEWLGDVPEGWGVRAFRRILRNLEQGTSPVASGWPANSDEWGVLKLSAVKQGRFLPDENKALDEIPSGCEQLTPARGDVLITRANTPSYVGDVARVPESAPNRLIPDLIYRASIREAAADSRFVAWYLLSRVARAPIEADARGSSGSMVKLSQGHIRGWSIPVPSPSEQHTIANFLDRETARLDTLIDTKRQLIERLREKRTALISHTVTRGLPPDEAARPGLPIDPPLKDSGIEWIGEIPAHWETLPFTKYTSDRSDYRGKTPEKVDDGVRLVTARNVRMGYIDYDVSKEFVAAEDYDEIMRRGLPKIGDILFTTEAPLGNVALVDREDVALAQRIIRFRMQPDKLTNEFAVYSMMSGGFQAQLQALSSGSTAEGIKASKLPLLRIAAAPLDEQMAIAAFLDRETSKTDRLVDTIQEAIDRLQEYRAALITAAVTGKIDVREDSA